MNGWVKRRWKALLWGGSIGLVIVGGMYYFPREYPGMGRWESLYDTLRLFIFERDVAEFPRHWQLIFIYFAAPAIALSAVGTAVSALFKYSPMLRVRLMRDHVVICGVGRTGKLLAATLLRDKVPVVGVDIGEEDTFREWLREKRLPMLYGDFHSGSLLSLAGAARARSVVFASGDDLANLEGAIAAYDWLRTDEGPVRLIWAHIAHEKLASVARVAVRTEGRVGIRFFDTYRIAAIKMINTYFNAEKRKGVSEINIIGFGKFGRDLLEILLRNMSEDEKFEIKVIDLHNREREVVMLANDYCCSERVSFRRAAIQELELVDEADKAFFICTDDDLGNLTAAMMLAAKGRVTYIFVRMNRWPLAAMAERLGEDSGVVFVNIGELVSEGLEELPGLLRPATEEDLKRVKGKMD